VLHTHGYREYFEVAAERGKPVTRLNAADLAEVRVRVVEHIQQYSRRQRSFLRKLPSVRVVRPTDSALAASAILRPAATTASARPPGPGRSRRSVRPARSS
jgi:tRNA A37 N6-isopentenylltransferase MiaA